MLTGAGPIFADTQALGLWFVASIMTLAALLAALWPLLRDKTKTKHEASSEQDSLDGAKQVLIDQLEEIERDRDRGLMDSEEAKGARAELARRLLALDREAESVSLSQQGAHRFYPLLSIVLIPAFTVGLYTILGAPSLPDQPIASRTTSPIEAQDINVLVARIEAHLAENPDELQGWQTIAPVYTRLQRFDRAETAYRKWLELVGDDTVSKGTAQAGLGQVLSLRTGGQIEGEILALFEEARLNAPDDPTGYLFRAVGYTQANRKDEAIAAWRELIERFGEANPPWLPMAKQSLEAMQALEVPPQSGETGPTAEQIEAAEDLSSEERREFVEDMVARLADRLKDSPDDLAGWKRLLTSYMVLGKRDEATSVLNRALAHYEGNDAALEELNTVAKEQGL